MAVTLQPTDTVRRIALAAAAATLAASTVALAGETPKKPLTFGASPELARGKYLVAVMGCDDCHTPWTMTEHGPEPDKTRRFMGHPAAQPFEVTPEMVKLVSESQVAVFGPGNTAIAGPWGVSYSANLTPDDTGIGSWTEAQFIKAIREGKSKGLDGARPLLPPMPWQMYRNFSDDDLKAIFAFLKSVQPMKNAVPNPKPLAAELTAK